MGRFVSALGPDLPPAPPPDGYDVKFRKSTKTYDDALAESALLQDKELRGSQLTTVIYRLSYDDKADKFFPWRQTEEEPKGEQKSRADKSVGAALAYEIYTAPSRLLTAEGTRALDQQVDLIATHSQTREPGSAGPH